VEQIDLPPKAEQQGRARTRERVSPVGTVRGGKRRKGGEGSRSVRRNPCEGQKGGCQTGGIKKKKRTRAMKKIGAGGSHAEGDFEGKVGQKKRTKKEGKIGRGKKSIRSTKG